MCVCVTGFFILLSVKKTLSSESILLECCVAVAAQVPNSKVIHHNQDEVYSLGFL